MTGLYVAGAVRDSLLTHAALANAEDLQVLVHRIEHVHLFQGLCQSTLVEQGIHLLGEHPALDPAEVAAECGLPQGAGSDSAGILLKALADEVLCAPHILICKRIPVVHQLAAVGHVVQLLRGTEQHPG